MVKKKNKREKNPTLNVLRQVVGQSSNLVIVTDREGNIEYVNPHFEKVTGYAPKEVLGKNPRLLKSDHTSAKEYATLWKTILKGKVWRGEFKNRRKNGDVYWASANISPVRNGRGEIISFIGIEEDITRRKEREGILKEHSESLAKANRELAEIRKNLLMKINDLEKSKQEINEEREITLSLLEDASAARIELMKNKEVLEELNVKLEEKVKERTRDLLEAHEKLLRSEKLSAIGQLAGAVAHEIRNPLSGLANAAYFLNMCDPSKEEDRKDMSRHLILINKQIQSVNQIVTNLLNFAKVKEPQMRETKVSDIVHEALEKFPPPAGVELTVDIAKELPPVGVDPLQICQVLTNLIDNAYQAMPKGGRLILRAGRRNEKLIISCQDSGCGIDPAKLNKIFEPLFSTKPKGTGLGLAICRQIVESHGGKLTVESILDQGSQFVVKLPLLRGETEPKKSNRGDKDYDKRSS